MRRSPLRTCTRPLALTLLAILLAAPATAASCPRTSLPAIENEVMCPICGTSLATAGGPQAERQREFIRRRVERCQTAAQIKAALVREYGPQVLAQPRKRGFELSAWLVPVIAGALALALGTIGAVRWRRRQVPAPHDGNHLGTSTADQTALEADRARYDL